MLVEPATKAACRCTTSQGRTPRSLNALVLAAAVAWLGPHLFVKSPMRAVPNLHQRSAINGFPLRQEHSWGHWPRPHLQHSLTALAAVIVEDEEVILFPDDEDDEDGPEGGTNTDQPPVRSPRVTALGGQWGNFILEIGEQKFLINPKLDDPNVLEPGKVHELVDYVVVTSTMGECFHKPTLARLNSRMVNILAPSGAVGEKILDLGFENVQLLIGDVREVLRGGLTNRETADVIVAVVPGSPRQLPWEEDESSFIFVDTSTGLVVGYEAVGGYMRAGTSAQAEGFPEEAWLIDYLITSNVHDTGEVLSGLAGRGQLSVRGVVSLMEAPGDDVSLLTPLLAVDKAIDKAMGSSGETIAELRDFLKKKGPPFSEVQLLEAVAGGAPVVIE